MENKILNSFFEKERRKVLSLLKNKFSLSNEDSEDIYQNSCVALFENIKDGKLKSLNSSLSTYFISICKNQSLKYFRDSKKYADNVSLENINEEGIYHKIERDNEEENGSIDLAQVERILNLDNDLTEAQAQYMRDIVKSLPEPCETILWSYYADDLQMKEIAKIINYSNGDSVKAKKSQCISRLKARFNKTSKEFYD